MAGVPGLEPGPKVLETSMLTIDTIPLWYLPADDRSGLTGDRLEAAVVRPALITCFPGAACGSGNGGRTF